MNKMRRSQRLGAFETPDLSRLEKYSHRRKPRDRNIGSLQPARRIFQMMRSQNLLNFLLRYGEFDSSPQDSEWLIYRILGAGTHGQVSAWNKKAADGDVVDEIALKEQMLPRLNKQQTPENWYKDDRWSRLTQEAVIHRQVNTLGSESESKR